MSQALPGEHYCERHRGNSSHYAEKNCRVCRLIKDVDDTQARARELIEQWKERVKNEQD